MALVVRRERPEDEREISEVVAAAFRDASVAEFTESIRASAGYVPELTFVGRGGRSHRRLRDAELRRPRTEGRSTGC